MRRLERQLVLGECGAGDSEPPTDGDDGRHAHGGGAVSAAAGKKVFTTNCGSCHTLADAGTDGSVGPNLDDLKPTWRRSSIR